VKQFSVKCKEKEESALRGYIMFKKKKIGVAMGGGGVRALASIGVLRRLKNLNIKIDCIAGTSMGSIIAGMYAYYRDVDKVEERFRNCLKIAAYKELSDEFQDILKNMDNNSKEKNNFTEKFQKYFSQIYFVNKFLAGISVIKKEKIEPVVNYLIPDINIEDLDIKLCCVGVNIIEGETEIMKKGSLRKAVMGSIAIPGIMVPEKWDDKLIIDGGSAKATPVEEVRELGADKVIAIEVMSKIRQKDFFDNGMEIIERSSRITAKELHNLSLKKADIIISPAVKNIFWANFKKLDYCITAGEIAAYDILDIMRK
jgi:NTE family protein